MYFKTRPKNKTKTKSVHTNEENEPLDHVNNRRCWSGLVRAGGAAASDLLTCVKKQKPQGTKRHIENQIAAAGRGSSGSGPFAKAGSELSLRYAKKERGLSRVPVPTRAGIPDIARPPRYPTRPCRRRRRRLLAGYVSAGLSAPFSSSCVPAPPPFCAQQW